MSSFSMDTRSMSSSPLVNSLVKNRLFKTAPDIDEPPFQFIHTIDLSVVDTHDAAWQPRSRNPQDWAVGWTQESLAFLTQHFNCCTCVARCADCRCTVLLEQSRYQRIAGSGITLLWRRKAAWKKSVRDITRIFCYVTTMKLPHALQIYSIYLHF